MKNNFSFWCQTFAADAILHVSAGVPSKKRRIMNYTKIILAGLVALSSTAFAMPTPEQTKKVEPLVVDLMRDDQAALKSGKKTRVEVAESAMSLADQAESEAAKLLLMKGAFNLYVRAGEFDKAIETLQSLQTAIPDIPPSNMANIIETSLRSVPRKNGGQLYRLLDETKTRMRYTNEAASLEKSVKKTPTDRALRLKLAEHYAYLGKWDLALENFVAAGGKVGAIAKSEREEEAATEKIADFWWDYPNGKADELVRGFRVHAAKLYEDAIAAGAIKGLNKVQAERRIEDAKELGDVVLWGSEEKLATKSATSTRVDLKTDTMTGANNVERQRQIAQQLFVKERAIYGNAAREEIEKLYQELLKTHDYTIAQKLMDKYPLANSTGCAILDAAGYVPGPKREELLKMAIQKFDGCYYGDGARVGVIARVLLAHRYNGTKRTIEGRALWREIVEKYPDAIHHGGTKVIDSMPDWAK